MIVHQHEGMYAYRALAAGFRAAGGGSDAVMVVQENRATVHSALGAEDRQTGQFETMTTGHKSNLPQSRQAIGKWTKFVYGSPV